MRKLILRIGEADDGWMVGWMDGWMVGRLDGWMDVWMAGRFEDLCSAVRRARCVGEEQSFHFHRF